MKTSRFSRCRICRRVAGEAGTEKQHELNISRVRRGKQREDCTDTLNVSLTDTNTDTRKDLLLRYSRYRIWRVERSRRSRNRKAA